MNRGVSLLVLLILLAAACKNKTTDDESSFFPVLSYLKSQVRGVDTSLLLKVKITKAHGTVDTTYLKKGDFGAAVQDFLSLPDIASPDLRKKYTETKLYDEDLKKVVITYLPKDKADYEQITRQDVIIEPGTSGANDQVATVYIETVESNRDSSVQKKMTWYVNGSRGQMGGDFQVITLINKPGQPEQVQTTDVYWMSGP